MAGANDRDLRVAWRELVDVRMPEAARSGQYRWPVSLNHCFARILLDNAVGAPWRSVIAPPAWRNAPVDVLARAITLGEAAIDGKADLAVLNARSLMMRGKQKRVGSTKSL